MNLNFSLFEKYVKENKFIWTAVEHLKGHQFSSIWLYQDYYQNTIELRNALLGLTISQHLPFWMSHHSYPVQPPSYLPVRQSVILWCRCDEAL